MKRNTKQVLLTIARTGVLLALLIAVQYITAPTHQLITGSGVNCILALAALFAGLWGGIAVAAVSPVVAFLLGIGPKLPQVVPAIMLGNMILVICVRFLLRGSLPLWRKAIGVAAASLAKFACLYAAVVLVMIPVMGPALPAKQAQNLSAMFSVPQLITALIGTTLAILIAPLLNRAIKEI